MVLTAALIFTTAMDPPLVTVRLTAPGLEPDTCTPRNAVLRNRWRPDVIQSISNSTSSVSNPVGVAVARSGARSAAMASLLMFMVLVLVLCQETWIPLQPPTCPVTRDPCKSTE